jgi:hypothetical protein
MSLSSSSLAIQVSSKWLGQKNRLISACPWKEVTVRTAHKVLTEEWWTYYSDCRWSTRDFRPAALALTNLLIQYYYNYHINLNKSDLDYKNLRLHWKSLLGASILAYYKFSQITDVKSFITLGLRLMKTEVNNFFNHHSNGHCMNTEEILQSNFYKAYTNKR